MKRVVNVVRMQLVNRDTFVLSPLLVLSGAFLVSYAIYAIIHSAGVTEVKYGGGSQAPLWYMGIIGAQALTRTFPFSQAMSVTRRDFYFGTVLTAFAGSAILAGLFAGIGLLEEATGGFWVNGVFATLPWIWGGGALVAFCFYLVLAMFVFLTGFAFAVVFKRFGMPWLIVGLLGLAVVLVGLVWLVTATGSWMNLFNWFGAQGVGSITAWLALATVVVAGVAFWPLRRATP